MCPSLAKRGWGDFIKFNIYLLLKDYVEAEKSEPKKKAGRNDPPFLTKTIRM
jgi:hypothetical protein